MKVKLTAYNTDTIMWVDISRARCVYKSALDTTTVIEFNADDYICVKESIEEISAQLPGGIRDH